jgi:hypothetical protein
MSEKRILGNLECPVCFEEVELRQAKGGRPYIVCELCGIQLFTRSQKSAKILTDLLSEVKEKIPAAKPEKIPAVVQEKIPEAKPEKTIFDFFGGD